MRKQIRKQYYLKQLEEIEKVRSYAEKPTLLMHTCCGVCAAYPALYLSEYFHLTLYFNNDNIYPFEEYQRRYEELVRLIDHYNTEHGCNIQIVKTPYQGPAYLEKLTPLKDEPERSRRCHLCYRLRMEEALVYAENHHFDYFTTVMTVSRQKDSAILNQIGQELITRHPNLRYFYSDFKKDGGLEKGNQLANEHQLYRQQYCGCYYSYLDYQRRCPAQHDEVSSKKTK